MKRWFAVHTHPNGEVRAATNLLQQGYVTYLPLHLKKRRHARRIDLVKRPLFPRYLFVQLDPEFDRWHTINSTFGVSHLVTNGCVPVALPEGVVEDIQGHETDDGVIVLGSRNQFSPGQRLEIIDGPMAEYSGAFSRMSDQGRVEILLDLLNQSIRVILPREAVVAA